ncbi:flagellar assembly factor FliW [Pullulanibacillus camelliae]|uniref:Flagellar assembly factor FliW n=1 Tax=Pullulanibacillus camelliae TaxID=1707096 RepID=A0A8J2YC99_9BACL|nr:flagellar assembly protein FliW [Pullulanibacillus camelliae]GGE36209.1 flagellar assembly factor FliW [Pullulanibacillus camelliae]
MQIQTKYFGPLDVDQENVIRFANGVPGFPEEKAFIFLPLEADSVYQIMQSTQTPALAFVTVSPFMFFKDYSVELSETVIEALNIEKEQDVYISVILTLKKPFKASTANLVAPVIVNLREKQGKQVVLDGTSYHTKHPIFQPSDVEEEDRHAYSKKKAK